MFPDGYLKQVYENGWPSINLQFERTPAYEMLDPDQRVAFFDVILALVRKTIAGEVKTGYLDKNSPLG